MKKVLKVVLFGSLLLGSLVGCKEETNTTNEGATNNTTENNENNNNTVVDPKLTGISVDANNVKKAYTYGEALDLTGLVVTANYDNNTNKAVTDYTTNPANGSALNTVGEVSVTVTYQEKTGSFKVTVEKSLTGISLNTENVKTSYNHKETLDLTGLVVNAVYNDGSTEAVTDYTTNPANGTALNTVGNQTVTVTYKDKTSSFDVAVNKTLSSIAINTDNVKKEYKHNEAFSTDGLVVTATYSDGSTANVTNYTTNPINGATLDTVGNKTIAVTYEGKTKTYDINVVAVLVDISADSTNVKKDYKQNDKLDLTGLVVTANYSDGTTTNVTNYTVNPINGADLGTVGTQTITVTYEGKTVSFGVEVEKKLVSITLDTSNVKKEYYQGDSVDLTGLVVTANYSDGSTADVSTLVTNNVPDGYTFVVFNTLTVTISYNGKTASFNCTCSPFAEKGHTATIDLNREISIGPNKGWGANVTMITGYGTKGSNYRPNFKLVKRSTAEDSMTFVNGKTRFLAGDSIENNDKICGITKITVNGGSGNFTLSVGYSKDSMHAFLDSESSGGDRIFDNIPHVNYFLLTGKYDNYPADISSIEIEYTRNENFEEVAGTPKTIDDVTVYEGTFIKGDKSIVVSGNTLTLNGNEYTFVGIEYKGSLLYRDHSTNGLLVKYNNENQIDVVFVNDHFDSISGAYNKAIPATNVAINVNGSPAAETSATNRVSMKVGDTFTVSATCNASPVETPVISLVDETNGDANPYVGTYSPKSTITIEDIYGVIDQFELKVEAIVVTKVGDKYYAAYKSTGEGEFPGFDDTYEAQVSGTSISFGTDDDKLSVVLDLESKDINVTYVDEDLCCYCMGDIGYNFASSSKPTATLENNKVTATKVGDFYIKAVASNGVEAKYYVHVNAYVPATLTVGSLDVTVKVGEFSFISASVNEDATNKEITYTSANPSIARVDGNVITGESVGKTTVTVSSADDYKVINVTVNADAEEIVYTFYDDASCEHELVVYPGEEAFLNNYLHFIADSDDSYYLEGNEEIAFTLRIEGTVAYLENITDDEQCVFGSDGPVYLIYSDSFELTETSHSFGGGGGGLGPIIIVNATKNYTFEDDNGDSHTVSVIENDSLNIDGTYQFVYLNTESAYVYENDASVKVTIRDAGGAIYLEILDYNQVIFGFQEDCGVCSYNTDQFELTEVEEQNNSSSGNATNNSSTTNTSTDNGGTSNASTNTDAEISQGYRYFTSLPTSRTTLYFLNKYGDRVGLDYNPNYFIICFLDGTEYFYDDETNTYRGPCGGELSFEIKNNRLVLKSNKSFKDLPGFGGLVFSESFSEIELLK
ncbi:MAG: bacterial Ig-like domain-containing protein [Bacilli bacterium]|nr:bacterial Ig-like domain-containing protein [Bacilli bacterium]